MTEAYPLQWPAGRSRTKTPQRARFDVTMSTARDELMSQLRLLGARSTVLSTNVELRRDGLPYANQKEPEDSAAAVYFQHKGRAMCFSCDRWDRVKDNIRAISKTIEAMRGIERWGTGEMVQAAFSGFEALPPPGDETVASKAAWWVVLGVSRFASEREIRKAYKDLVREAGGATVDLNAAKEAALMHARAA